MWQQPTNWPEPKDELGRYVFGVPEPNGRTKKSSSKKPEKKSSSGHTQKEKRSNDKSGILKQDAPTNSGTKRSEKRVPPHKPFQYGPETKRVTCEICQRTFFDKSTFNRHNASVHATNKPYSCSHCGRSYAKQSLLRQHVKVSYFLFILSSMYRF